MIVLEDLIRVSEALSLGVLRDCFCYLFVFASVNENFS